MRRTAFGWFANCAWRVPATRSPLLAAASRPGGSSRRSGRFAPGGLGADGATYHAHGRSDGVLASSGGGNGVQGGGPENGAGGSTSRSGTPSDRSRGTFDVTSWTRRTSCVSAARSRTSSATRRAGGSSTCGQGVGQAVPPKWPNAANSCHRCSFIGLSKVSKAGQTGRKCLFPLRKRPSCCAQMDEGASSKRRTACGLRRGGDSLHAVGGFELPEARSSRDLEDRRRGTGSKRGGRHTPGRSSGIGGAVERRGVGPGGVGQAGGKW